jgi:hypothetical protein
MAGFTLICFRKQVVFSLLLTMLRPSLSSTSTIETTIFLIFAVALLMISQVTSDSFSDSSTEEEVRPPQRAPENRTVS